jgi:hypothetical protein
MVMQNVIATLCRQSPLHWRHRTFQTLCSYNNKGFLNLAPSGKAILDFRFSRWSLWRVLSSGMWYRVVWQQNTFPPPGSNRRSSKHEAHKYTSTVPLEALQWTSLTSRPLFSTFTTQKNIHLYRTYGANPTFINFHSTGPVSCLSMERACAQPAFLIRCRWTVNYRNKEILQNVLVD